MLGQFHRKSPLSFELVTIGMGWCANATGKRSEHKLTEHRG